MNKNVEECLMDLRTYLNSADAAYTLGKKKELFFTTLFIIERDAEECDKDAVHDFPNNPSHEENIKNTLNFLLAVLNEQVVSEDASKFIEKYSTLVYNWNNNIAKEENINTLSQTINRFVDLRITTVELLQYLKRVTKTIRELSHVSFQPYELSKHYLASFDKKQDK